jgi:hypothetical protein
LFWAIRGGGGGTWGVVVEATIKVHPDVPITGYNWYLNSTKKSTPEEIAKGIYPTSEAMKYLMGELPALQKQGVSAYFYVGPTQVRAFAVHPGTQAGIAKANALWEPILTKMQSFQGMTKFQTKPYEFKNFKEFFGVTYGVMSDSTGMIVHKRHGPTANEFSRWRGIVPYDTRLLSAEHLQSPKILEATKETEGNYGILLCSPGPAVGDGKDTSTTPAWRKAVVHFVGMASPKTNVDGLRKLAPEMGSYINEVCITEML